MRRMKAEQKRKLAGIIAIVLILAMVLSAATPIFMHLTNAAPVSTVGSDYSIEANVGFNGVAKIGEKIPIVVTVTNNSAKKLDGVVSLLAVSSSNNKYSYEIELPAGGSKRVEFSIPVKYIQKEIKIELTSGNKTLKEESFPLSVGAYSDCWLGLISDNTDEISCFSGIVQSVELSPCVQGTSFADFDAFNVFVVNNYDLAALSDAQISAVIERVSNGAVLVLGRGSYIGSIDRLGLDSLQKVTDTELVGYDTYTMGKGFVVSIDVDFADVNSVNNSDVQSLFSNIVEQTSTNDDNDSFSDNLLRYTDRLPNLTDKTITVIFGILYLYIAFIPILYVVLKKRDRRENAIKIIPITAVALSLVIYLLSFNTVYKKPIASIVNYVDLDCKTGDTVALKSAANIISPAKGRLAISLDKDSVLDDVSDTSYDNDYNYYGSATNTSNTEQKIMAEISMNDSGTVIIQNNKKKWDNTYISMTEPYRIENGFVSTAEINENGNIEGCITNNTGEDFSEAVAMVYSNEGIYAVQVFNNVKNGDNVDLAKLNVNLLSDTPGEYYNFGNVIINDSDYYSNRRGKNNENNRLRTEQDILDDIGTDLSDSDYSAYLYDGVNVAIVGFSDTAIVGDGILVNNRSANIGTVNAFKESFSVSLNGLDNLLTFTIDKPMVQAESNAEIENNNIFVYDAEKDVKVCILNSKNEPFAINWYDDAADLYIHNLLTDEWEYLETGCYYDVNSYVDSSGMVHLKASDVVDYYIDLPNIKYDIAEDKG